MIHICNINGKKNRKYLWARKYIYIYQANLIRLKLFNLRYFFGLRRELVGGMTAKPAEASLRQPAS
jgi:hypothetical protein